ncbi:MAG: DUF1178 family protein [Proteobacteria bacterium]|nr:DUF1178 family protein [Pseudomonadota bacterium]
MIHYQVRCSRDHEFDGWFKDSAAFDKQSARGLVECPVCGDTKVSRALMAPAVSKRQAEQLPVPVPVPAAVPAAPADKPAIAAGGRMPAQVRAMLQRLRQEVERNCDYVGADFAEEARKIHRGESDRRGIYGEATREESEALASEGIEVGNIPWVPLSDS